MVEEGNWALQVSLKNANQTLINVRGNSEVEIAGGLAVIQNLADQIGTTEALLGPLMPIGAARVTTPAGDGAVQEPPTTGAAPATYGAPAPTCEHGLPAKFVPGGVSRKTQKPYKAFWACAQDQAYQCKFRQDG